jgi:NTF2 fold immunity protein
MIRRVSEQTFPEHGTNWNLRCPIKLEPFLMKPIAALLLCFLSVFGRGSLSGVVPKQGFVPNESVALAIAEAVLIPVYGKGVVDYERPFKAVLEGNVWTITGSVPCDGPRNAICPGGAAEVRISKRTGQILFMTHYQ